MRKEQKQNILDVLTSLSLVIEQVKNELEKKNVALVQQLLEQCQSAAIQVGNVIEASEGEGFVTVTYLEEYCDLIYKKYQELNGEYNINRIYKALRKGILKIENSVKYDIPIRKEVVFFPYKASMWDSLESVYLNAAKDPNCDAYVVPIPYFDLNPDRTFGKMHYEGNEYPNNIPITNWETYNFEDRKPDVMYIHNPYDNWNLVTSVHPRFYSSNLKKYTDELVYIPYFVLPEIEPDDQVAIENIKHFCYLPGIVHADKVIVQSENMRQIYINEYMKVVQQRGQQVERKQLEEKILGLGSPKFDKVMNTKKEDLEIPKEWLKIIEKPDGSWKKIVFYNTGISALLQDGTKWVDKIENVLKIFKENQDEIVLLWRPHPLIENTMKSMRSEVLQKYVKIKLNYLNEGWGIYDDTADMDRAVVLGDAYYGDASSIMSLFLQLGKITLIQNVKIFDNYMFMNGISSSCSYIDKNNNVWLPSRHINGLFSGKVQEDLKLKYVNSFKHSKNKNWKIQSIIEWNGDIYFFSLYKGQYWKLQNNEIEMFEYDIVSNEIITNVFIYNSYVYIISQKLTENIMILDLKTNIIKSIYLPNSLANKGYVVMDAIMNNGKIFIAVNGEESSFLVLVDCETDGIECFINKHINKISCIAVCKSKVSVLGVDEKINLVLEEYDLEGTYLDSFPIIYSSNEDNETKKHLFIGLISNEKYYIAIPCLGNQLLIIKKSNKKEKYIDIQKILKYKRIYGIQTLFNSAQIVNNMIYEFPCLSNQGIQINMEEQEINTFDVVCNWKEYQNLVYTECKNKEILNESETINIKLIIKMILRKED